MVFGLYFHVEKKLSKPTWPCVKNLKLVTNCATLGSRNCYQVFVKTDNKSFPKLGEF